MGRNHSLFIGNTGSNKCFVDALETIDRSRAEPRGAAYEAITASISVTEAVVYAAFHQFFATQKYTHLLNLKRAFDDQTIQDAKDKLVVVHTIAIAADAEIRTLEAAAAAPELPFDFSVPAAQIPALRAAAKVNAANAMVAAKRARTDAFYAEIDGKNDIRKLENYRAYIIHDNDRARDDIRTRKGCNDRH